MRGKFTALAVLAAATVMVGGLAGPTGAVAGSSNQKLTISPAKGTPNASAETQISVLGIHPDKIKSVELTGEQSGAHSGQMRSYSGKRGASFLPDEPLTEGERANFTVRIKGRDGINSWFDVGVSGPDLPFLTLTSTQPEKLRHYQSLPGLVPPKITVEKNSHRTTGDLFLTPLPSPTVHPGSDNTVTIEPVGPGGPMIANRHGQVVWFRQLEQPTVAANLRIQRYEGKKVLTWWQGGVTPWAYGDGKGVIANTSYRTVATVTAGNGYLMDLHEFELTDSGDALFTIYKPQMVHLPGTPEGTLSRMMDAIVQQVDVKTGLVVWEWHSYGHIPLEDSRATPENSASYDAYHLNSIQQLGGGRVLVSARNTSAVYKIDKPSGKVLWTLGGTASSFRMKKGAEFFLQHHARKLNDGRISVYDDGAGPPKLAPFSRGLMLELDHKRMTAKVSREYSRSNETSAESEGSVQTRGNGNVFVGFGSEPEFSEFSKKGKLLYDASQPEDNGSYRVYRHNWSASPKTQPVAVARRTDGSAVSIFVSWNGDTKTETWQVLAGASGGPFRPVATAERKGFETRIDLTSPAEKFKLRALDPDGRVLSTSAGIEAS
ncbi:MAG: aryl-sulfate sulfotransferase [Thermoleophilia bacterium]|nr:aryl-sulfate sulfotransferase [Thermoleophilia bacterium]